MKKHHTLVAGSAFALLCATAITSSPAGAGDGLPTPVVDPPSGPVGTVFTVSVTGCDPDAQIPVITVVADGTDEGMQSEIGEAADFDFTVSDDTDAGDIEVEAQCGGRSAQPLGPPTQTDPDDYPVAQFTVTETPTSEPPTSEPPTSEPPTSEPPAETTEPVPGPPEAVAADAVVETPTLTG